MSDTGRPGPDSAHPGGRPAWGPTGATPPVGPIQPPTAPSTLPTTPPPVTSWQPPAAATPVAGAAVPVAGPESIPPTTDSEPTAPTGERPKWLFPAIIGVVALVAAAIIIGIVASNSADEAAAPPAVASTILLPSPTPSVAPAARTANTTFAKALPTSVLQYALAASADNPAWVQAGAIEAYTETYTDGAGGTVTVSAGQWETPDEATAFAATLVAALPAAPAPDPTATAAPTGPTLPQSGDVMVSGAAAGTFTIVNAGDGTGVAVWTNGSAVFQATAPVADIVDVYAAYPL